MVVGRMSLSVASVYRECNRTVDVRIRFLCGIESNFWNFSGRRVYRFCSCRTVHIGISHDLHESRSCRCRVIVVGDELFLPLRHTLRHITHDTCFAAIRNETHARNIRILFVSRTDGSFDNNRSEVCVACRSATSQCGSHADLQVRDVYGNIAVRSVVVHELAIVVVRRITHNFTSLSLIHII